MSWKHVQWTIHLSDNTSMTLENQKLESLGVKLSITQNKHRLTFNHEQTHLLFNSMLEFHRKLEIYQGERFGIDLFCFISVYVHNPNVIKEIYNLKYKQASFLDSDPLFPSIDYYIRKYFEKPEQFMDNYIYNKGMVYDWIPSIKINSVSYLSATAITDGLTTIPLTNLECRNIVINLPIICSEWSSEYKFVYEQIFDLVEPGNCICPYCLKFQPALQSFHLTS